MPDTTDRFYDVMCQSYEDADDVEKGFWMWTMTEIMPIVSRDWSDRLKGRRVLRKDSVTGAEMPEEIGHYLSCSDFAYVPLVIRVYGKRELEDNDNANGGEEEEKKRKIRTKGRTKGQSGLTSKENIALYVKTFIRMKTVLESEQNRAHVKEWGDSIFEYIKSVDTEKTNKRSVTLQAITEAARIAAEEDIRRMKKDDIYIPV